MSIYVLLRHPPITLRLNNFNAAIMVLNTMFGGNMPVERQY
jgi:hypothetical protein